MSYVNFFLTIVFLFFAVKVAKKRKSGVAWADMKPLLKWTGIAFVVMWLSIIIIAFVK